MAVMSHRSIIEADVGGSGLDYGEVHGSGCDGAYASRSG